MKKLGWGLVGGGEGSQIGFAHRAGSVMDGKFQFLAGAMDIDPKRAVEFGIAQGLDKERCYG
ncbi:MAG: gfo/Idh/MocA family oxidoreductase, partial [Deltaproteobacteria bacterium]